MSTIIRPELSRNNKYWISKHRYYELKHFCMQYSLWKKAVSEIGSSGTTSTFEWMPSSGLPGNPTANLALMKICYSKNIEMVEKAAEDADKFLSDYILKAATEGYSYTYLKYRLGMPYSRDLYYDRYRRFFWLLSQERD